uniref:Uncharacterized protein n=1 Tax=Candidatus Kentrum sp. LPFa TaxID=2126335 RepID=A0A450WT95_9GAMM|nr:MAG: hypothetical protein BECKLPF1236A_GA0070988_1025411 [Candidatus Kentron sp. LPFa]VFK34294.1 MAG: hypothetical protein BECKLPF1236C_GA0070990_1025711 [Candidatus Kentron sp. LPFa]
MQSVQISDDVAFRSFPTSSLGTRFRKLQFSAGRPLSNAKKPLLRGKLR